MKKTAAISDEKDFEKAKKKIEVSSEDDTLLVALNFRMTLFSSGSLRERVENLEAIQQRYFEVYPQSDFTFYARENSSKHKKAGSAAFIALSNWIKSKKEDLFSLEITDSKAFSDAPRRSFDVVETERAEPDDESQDASFVSMSFLAEDARNNPKRFADLFVELCTRIKFQSGIAGFSMSCSNYEEEESNTQAWKLGNTYKALDIFRAVDDSIAVGTDGLKGIGWLTALDPRTVDKLGGLSKLKKALPDTSTLIEGPNGVIIQLGPAPILGDDEKSLKDYKQLYKLLSPLIEVAAKRSPSFNIENRYVEKTEAWFARLA